jgi:hypothetical protein
MSVRTYEELLESAHEAMRRDDLLRAIDDYCAALSLVSDLRDDPRWLESRCQLARACFVEDTPIPAACSRHGAKAIELLGLTHFAFQGNEELGRLWEGRTWIKVASFAAVDNRQAENYWQYAVEGMERGKAPRHELVHALCGFAGAKRRPVTSRRRDEAYALIGTPAPAWLGPERAPAADQWQPLILWIAEHAPKQSTALFDSALAAATDCLQMEEPEGALRFFEIAADAVKHIELDLSSRQLSKYARHVQERIQATRP